MPFKTKRTIRSTPVWLSVTGRGRGKSVPALIEEVGFILYQARQYGLKGWADPANGYPPRGFHKVAYLVELGVLKPMVIPIGQDDGYFQPYEITSLAALEAALADLKAVETDHAAKVETELVDF